MLASGSFDMGVGQGVGLKCEPSMDQCDARRRGECKCCCTNAVLGLRVGVAN